MLRTAFVDDVAAAKDFASGDVVRKTDFRGFFPSPYAGRVVFVDYRNGTVQVQWPWGSEQEYPTELIRDTSGDVMPPDSLDQTYSSWAESRFRNDEATVKADQKWRKKLASAVVARYEDATMPVWRAACKAHHSGMDEVSAYLSVCASHADEFGDDAVRLTVANLYEAGRSVPARLALYWKDKGRRYKVTQREKSVGKIRCPRCSTEGMKPMTYRAGKKVLNCRSCGFSISPKDLIWDDSGEAQAPDPAPEQVKAASPKRRAQAAAEALLCIAASVASASPAAAAALHAAVAGRIAVVNPGVKGWERYIDEMLAVLKSLDQELDQALSDYETAEEFSKFFEDGIAEEDELRKILDSTKKLGKVASAVAADDQTSGFKDFFKTMKKKFLKDWDGAPDDPDSTSVPAQYHMDEKAMDDFVEGSRDWLDASQYVEMEYSENRDFFDSARALLADMDDVRIEPSREKIRAIRDRIPAIVKRGQDILGRAREHLRAESVETEDQDEASGDDVNPSSKSIQIEDDDGPKPHGDSHGEKDPKHLQWTVKHYVDMLRESLDDPEKMKKYLKELYNEVGPQLKAASDARRLLTPRLIKLARARQDLRPVILPAVRAYAGR